jgi:hypothetical protein
MVARSQPRIVRILPPLRGIDDFEVAALHSDDDGVRPGLGAASIVVELEL